MKAVALALLLIPAAARADPTLLDVGIQRFNDLDDGAAETSLHAFLQQSPAKKEAARAHVYLGLIRLNALKLDEAQAEFKAALQQLSTVELPYGVSPKAHVIFDQARSEFADESARMRPSTQPPTAQPVELTQPATPAQKPSLVPPVVVLATGVVALGVAVGFGLAEQQAQNQSNSSADAVATQAQADHNVAASDALVADVCYAAGGAVALAGVVWLVVALTSGNGGSDTHTAATLVPTRGGLSAGLSVGF